MPLIAVGPAPTSPARRFREPALTEDAIRAARAAFDLFGWPMPTPPTTPAGYDYHPAVDTPCTPGRTSWWVGGPPIPRWLEREMEAYADVPASPAQVRYMRRLGIPSEGVTKQQAMVLIDGAVAARKAGVAA